MPNAIRFHKSGGPEVLVSEPVPIGKPGPGEAHVRQTAVGVNFVDIYIRTGLYPAVLPSGLGTEAAGVVEDVGPGVVHVKAGDRVAYAGGPLGAYSEMRVMPADRLVALPQSISDQQAAFRVLNALRLAKISNNLGDAKSLVTHPATTTHQRLTPEARAELGIGDGFIRFSAGLEHADDLIEDLAQALEQV